MGFRSSFNCLKGHKAPEVREYGYEITSKQQKSYPGQWMQTHLIEETLKSTLDYHSFHAIMAS
jgi:hypothetical protein